MSTAGLKRAPKKEDVANEASFFSKLVNGIADRYTDASKRAVVLYARAQPYLTWGADTAWAIASTAVIVALPVLVEVQRETTVMVMQKQREREITDMQEQAKVQNGGFVEQMSGMAKMLTGAPVPQQ